MKTVCAENTCVGCMACMDTCRKGAIDVKEGFQFYNAVIDETKCVGCNACFNVCQQNKDIEFSSPKVWLEGWSKDNTVRESSSSGGVATALTLKFLEEGNLVYSCAFKEGKFCFIKVSKKDVFAVKGSKYVKSNPKGVYPLIDKDLKDGKKVLFIGLPCQVSALKLYVNKNLQKDLYTVDLICHGTPSPKLLDKFLQENKKDLNNIETISFRNGSNFSLSLNSKRVAVAMDRYMIAFLHGLSYTENCYSCKYARQERVSDITLGDSWGSELSLEEKKKGISLILCQTDKGRSLIEDCNLQLFNADKEKALARNGQLSSPSLKPINREKFFKDIQNGKKFSKAVFKAMPKVCIKQKVKAVLIKLGVKK